MNALQPQVILIGAGIIFLFFGITGYIILPKIGVGPRLTKWSQISLCIAGIVFVAIGIVCTPHHEVITPVPSLEPAPAPAQPTAPTPWPSLSTFTPINVPGTFYPSGWMGDWGDITLDDASTHSPLSGPTCIKITYSATRSQGKGWAGIYWQYPDSNWGENPEGRNLSGATRLTFWARGNKGGEKAEFKAGGITGKYPDSIQPLVSADVIDLSIEWQHYTIDLTGKDLSHIIGGFCWVTNKNQNPYGSTIFLDDIRYE